MMKTNGYSTWLRRGLVCASVAILTTSMAVGRVAAQSVTSVENLGTPYASQVSQGLGFNINQSNSWEFQLAQQAGSTEARFQCSWASTEIQSAPPGNSSEGYSLTGSACNNGLTYSSAYHQRPVLLAAYGAPYHNIVTLKVATDAPAGSYTISVTATSGSLTSINFPYCHVLESSGTQITATGYWAYYGALITAVNTTSGTITLAAKTAIDLPANTVLTVNELLYPSVATTSSTDPSINAYAGTAGEGSGAYTGFLATSLYNAGLAGRVEVWNEPPWAHDPWDTRFRFYDSNIPPGLSQPAVEFGFAQVLQTQTPPANVRYIWGGTEKSGFNSLLGTRISPQPTETQVMDSMAAESFHPYGNNPEDHEWYPACLAELGGNWASCALVGAESGSNFKAAVQYNLQNIASYGWGIEQDITETGLSTDTSTNGQQVKARFNMRQFLSFQALGLKRIDFYRFADSGSPDNYGFVDYSTHDPYPVYNSFQALMTDVNSITGSYTPSFTASNLPSVVSYSGYYPLTVSQIVGTTSSNIAANSIIFTCWQRSYTTGTWATMTSPAAVPVTIQIPSGMIALSARNLDSLANVPMTVSGSDVTFNVTDDPVEVMVVPQNTPYLTSADVNSNGPAGSASVSNGVYTVTGSGPDITGTSDGFHYYYQSLTGDGTIIARVASMQNTSTWAKAGVMIRETLTGGSAMAIMGMTPTSTHGTIWNYRLSTGASVTGPGGGGFTVPNYVMLVRAGNNFSGYTSPDGVTWTQYGTTQSIPMATTVYVGLAVTSDTTTATSTDTFDHVQIWNSMDINNTGPAGSASIAGGVYTVTGSGPDITGTSDGFHYFFQSLVGNGTITARVASMQNTSVWAKGGVMIRETLTAGSATAVMGMTPTSTHGSLFNYRLTTGGSISGPSDGPNTVPAYVRLVRSGNSFSGYTSPDGTTWTQFGSTQTIPMATQVYIGFAVTSDTTSATSTDTFDHVTITQP